MDKEFLLDYEEGELEERRNFLKSLDEDFEFETDRFPSDNRFPRLAKPVAEVSPRRTGGTESDIWAQVPFCGSLLVPLPPIDMPIFEKALFKVSEIPDIVDFVKERGRLQFALCALPSKYEGLDYLDPILKELKPPLITGLRMHDFVNAQEFSVANEAYSQLAKGRFREAQERAFSRTSLPQSTKRDFLEEHHSWFIFLKAIQHPFINDIENLMIDDPVQALKLLIVAGISIAEPLLDTRSDLRNLSLEDLRREDRYIPARYQHKARLPCEIGRFLFEKRTLAPVNLESCCDMLDNFHFGELRKIMKALNDGIMSNEYDVVSKNTKELSDILDNIWEDLVLVSRIPHP